MKRGFTLIEILVVVMIIGVLSTLVVINVVGTMVKARDTKRTADISSIKSAMGMFSQANGYYPSVLASVFTVSGGYEFSDSTLSDPVGFAKYLSPIPIDPLTPFGKNLPYSIAVDHAEKSNEYAFFLNYENAGTKGCSQTAWNLPADGKFCGCKSGSHDLDKGWWGNYDADKVDGTPICQ